MKKLFLVVFLTMLTVVEVLVALNTTFAAPHLLAYKDAQKISTLEDVSFQQAKDYFANLAQEKGAVHAFEVLSLAEFSSEMDTHLLGHIVGDELYRQKKQDAMQYCTQELRNACSHSVVVGMFLEMGESVLETVADTCRQSPGGVGAYTMCFHGFGHGVLAYTGYDFEKAVELCHRIKTDDRSGAEAAECVGGALMEMVSGVHDPEQWALQRDRFFSDEDAFYPCTAAFVPDVDRYLCVMYMTPRIAEYVGTRMEQLDSGSIAAIFQVCESADQPYITDACYAAFGKEFPVMTMNHDVRNIEQITQEKMVQVQAWCDLAASESGLMTCNTSAVSSLFWGGENDPQAAVAYCSTLSTESRQNVCYQYLFGAAAQYYQDESQKTQLCQIIPSSHQALCFATLLSN